MSWYRTYRPQTVSGLHITPVRESLSRILQSGEFSHAYLFCGPKGTGKTSGARILAKVLNCEKNKKTVETFISKKSLNSKPNTLSPLFEPCNECSSCLSITAGNSLSVVEMDAASNRGIDDIRTLREGIGLAPADGVVSVYIIDEVHMLTTEAFNALLKVLEEPPAHVVFLLATTDPQKMPATVLSRCTLIQYRKATSDEVMGRLQEIAKAEGIDVPSEVVSEIAKFADGSFRDAVKLFEQIGLGKKSLTITDVENSIGKSIEGRTSALLNVLMKKSVPEVIEIFSKLETDGIDGVLFQKEVLKTAHQKLIEFSVSNDKRVQTLIRLMQAIAVGIEPGIPIPALPFELACLEWCIAGTSPAPVQADVGMGKKSAETPVISTPVVTRKEFISQETPSHSAVERAEKSKHAKGEAVVSFANAAVFDMAAITQNWAQILRAVKQKSNPVEGLLRSTRPIGVDGSTLLCEANYKFHKEQLELERNRVVIENVLGEILGGSVRINFSLATSARKVSGSADSNISGNVDDTGLLKAATEAFL